MHVKKILRILTCVMALAVSTASAAPVVVIPGESAGYIYYSAGGSGAPTTPAADTSFVGMIAAFSTTPPTDTWVVCNGQTISAGTYPELVEFLAGAAAASAVMPNYQGYFLRGANTGASGVDPGRTVGSTQGDENKSHNHAGTTANSPAVSSSTSTDGAHTHSLQAYESGSNQGNLVEWGGSGTLNTLASSSNGAHFHTVTLPAHNHTFTTGSSGGTETRPVNIAVIYAMRAK